MSKEIVITREADVSRPEICGRLDVVRHFRLIPAPGGRGDLLLSENCPQHSNEHAARQIPAFSGTFGQGCFAVDDVSGKGLPAVFRMGIIKIDITMLEALWRLTGHFSPDFKSHPGNRKIN